MRIVCASIPGPGHAYPMLAVARALAARGHEVVFASGDRHARDAEQAGARLVELPKVGGSPLDDLRLYDDAAAMAEAFLPDLKALAPDAVVYDVITLAPGLAAEALGVPAATLIIHSLHTPSRDLPPFGFGEPPGRGPVGRVRDSWMRKGKVRDMERTRAELNGARARLGLPPTERIDAQLSPDLVLVATLPSLELPRSDWPSYAHVVGPCLWDAEGEVPALPEGDEPLVLIAASTAHDHGALLRASLDAVERLGVRAIVTAGASEMPRALPPRVVSAPFAPHDPILARASATICNGGHGILARSLSSGVPVVVVPNHGDQKENGYRAARAGAGIRVAEPRPRRLARALRRVLSDSSYRAAAARLREEAAAIDGPGRAAQLVEEMATRRAEAKSPRGALAHAPADPPERRLSSPLPDRRAPPASR